MEVARNGAIQQGSSRGKADRFALSSSDRNRSEWTLTQHTTHQTFNQHSEVYSSSSNGSAVKQAAQSNIHQRRAAWEEEKLEVSLAAIGVRARREREWDTEQSTFLP